LTGCKKGEPIYKQRHKKQREDVNKSKDKQDPCNSKEKYKNAARHARFEQVWSSRKRIDDNSDINVKYTGQASEVLAVEYMNGEYETVQQCISEIQAKDH